MKKIIIGLIVLILIIIVVNGSEVKEGNISINGSLFNLDGGNLSTYGDININASFLVSGNLSFRFELIPRNCTNLTGDFITKSLFVGKEGENFSIENGVSMTSYDGDFNRLNSTYTETSIHYSKTISSQDFTNESICTKLYLGILAEDNPEYKWYKLNSKPIVFKRLIGYACVRNFTQITYCE